MEIRLVSESKAPRLKAAGIPATKAPIPSIVTDFFLVHLNSSIKKATGTSTIEISDVRAAIPNKIKNPVPKSTPKNISLKILGRTTKISPAPIVGSSPNANSAGNIAKPAISAINVSSNATQVAEEIKFSSFER